MSGRRRTSAGLDKMELEAGKADRAEMPRKSWHRRAMALLALMSTLLLAVYLTAQVRRQLSPPSPLPVETVNTTHHVGSYSDKSRLSPADHIFRSTSTITHTWRVTSGLHRPDGVLKRIFLINDNFPGPTLEARSGDTLVVRVENALDDEGIAIHFHGLHMRGANNMDGAVGITQDPIPPGQSFTYQFTIDDDQHGTFWYHAHEGVQRADGLFGGLVVHKPVSKGTDDDPADEKLILVGDWYHRSAKDALQFYMHPGAFGLETIPDSILLNGVGNFQCSDAVPARPLDCEDIAKTHPAFQLDGGRRTILRVANVGAYAGIRIAASGALLTPLAVDGGNTIAGQRSSSVGFVQPGQRVDVLIEMDPEANLQESEIHVTLDDSIFKYENSALSISHSWPINWNGRVQKLVPSNPIEYSDVQSFESLQDQSAMLPTHADHTIVLYTLTQKLARLENEPRGFINSSTWRPQSPPLIDTPRTQWDAKQTTPHIPFSQDSAQWVDIILNNLDEDSHPFHLHGHNFWVLSRYSSDINWGSYNPYEDEHPPGGEYNIKSAIRKDTVYVPRRGYAVLRFKADNPGLWAFHCHVLWHEASGMAMAFDIS